MPRRSNHRNERLCFTVGKPVFYSDCRVFKLNIRMFYAYERDAVADMAQYVHSQQMCEEYRLMADAIRQATGSTTYLSADTSGTDELTLEWQSNDDSRNDYYAGRIDRCSLDGLAKVTRILKTAGLLDNPRDSTPRQVLVTLIERGAVAVKYLPSPVGRFVADSSFNLDTILPAKTAQAVAA